VSVTLRPAARADDAWLATWFPGLARSVGYDAGVRDPSPTRLIIERDAQGALSTAAPGSVPVGVIAVRVHAPKRGETIIELVATPAERARTGAGMQAAALLEEDLRARGVQRIYAPASEAHGIAMYFWIRLGYRPLLRCEWPCTREGVAWLARDL
jgi:hypothetical protein